METANCYSWTNKKRYYR